MNTTVIRYRKCSHKLTYETIRVVPSHIVRKVEDQLCPDCAATAYPDHVDADMARDNDLQILDGWRVA